MSRRRGKVCKRRKLNISTLTLGRKKTVKKLAEEYNYMDISLDFGEEFGKKGIVVGSSMLISIIENSLKLLFGEVGASTVFDVVKYRERNRRAILRFYERCHKAWLMRVYDIFSEIYSCSSTRVPFLVSQVQRKLNLKHNFIL
ncbi:ribonuclease P/MRP subunit p14 a isoform X1 [Tachypleus tridentatus]|uniref:ribonuclease P/MRP subunit p14 a isoform X1 n=1 Tax=Tachypleus tridentatus TaxID=6853 RepID=UPI003FCF6134